MNGETKVKESTKFEELEERFLDVISSLSEKDHLIRLKIETLSVGNILKGESGKQGNTDKPIAITDKFSDFASRLERINMNLGESVELFNKIV